MSWQELFKKSNRLLYFYKSQKNMAGTNTLAYSFHEQLQCVKTSLFVRGKYFFKKLLQLLFCQPEKCGEDKRSGLLSPTVSDEQKSFIRLTPGGRCRRDPRWDDWQYHPGLSENDKKGWGQGILAERESSVSTVELLD